MKKQINATIKAHLIRGAFYLLLLVTVCAIPFALAQRSATKGSGGQPNAVSAMPALMPESEGEMSNAIVPVSAAAGTSRNREIAESPVRVPPAPDGQQVILYDQYNNAASTTTLCARFIDMPTLDADLADDFVVPAGQTWSVNSIDASGVLLNGPAPAINGPAPAIDWNVFIYADNLGFPGTQLYSTLNQPVAVHGRAFTVNLIPPAMLTAGTYWIEIQPNMRFATHGKWGWSDRTVQSNFPAAWQNPGGGSGFCPSWSVKTVCFPSTRGPDQVFRISGTSNVTPTPSPTPTATSTETPTPTPTVTATFTPTGNSDCNSNSHGNRYPYCDSNCNCYTDCNSYCYCYVHRTPEPDTHGDLHAYSYSNSNSYCY